MKENDLSRNINSQEMIRYQTKINNFIIQDFRIKLDMFNNAEQNIIQLKELYSKFQRAFAQIPNLQLQRYKKAILQKSREFICRDEYTKMFKQALQMCLQADFCEASIQQICKTIHSLSKQQLNTFWTNVNQQIFSNFHYYKSNADIIAYFRQQYIKNILKINDKLYIKQFVHQNKQLSISKIVQHLMTSYFKSKDVYLNSVVQYVRYEKRLQHININNTYNYEDKVSSIYRMLNKVDSQLDQQTQLSHTDIYRKALKTSLNIEVEDSKLQICQSINKLNKQQSKTFWSYLKQTQKTAYIKLKIYYKIVYKSVLYSDHLTEDDKIFLRNQLDQDQTSSIADITQSLMQNYFKDRDIFYYEIYRYVFYQSKVQRSSIKRQNNQSYRKNYTEIYRQGLSHVLEQDMDINIEPEEIIKQIDQLDRKQSRQLWKFLESNVIPHKTVYKLKYHYRNIYQQAKKNQNQASSKTREQKQNNFTKFYNVALNALFQHPKDQSPKAICEIINNFDKQQSKQFWNYLTTIVEPKQSIALLKQYYNNSYQAALYSGRLTAEDKQFIQQFYEQNAELTKKQQTKQLLETQYKDRDIFYWEMYRYISYIEIENKKLIKQSK
ncbi:Hypothetical_protein [Hexamita inflata]|uniref:Hypothetical_protein n=1 Tax=Hexamita inflata TaxID=28002 RepID=A0AA86Q239_9EUKA|nr:Hypothetical protein HINF_LOCUS38345 [Hexamita inflata]